MEFVGDTSLVSNPLFRRYVDHLWYIDKNFPECGFLNRDEAHILFNAALKWSGKRALEIGSHVGWSTVHLALAGVLLDVVEPQLTYDPRVLLSLLESLQIANVKKILIWFLDLVRKKLNIWLIEKIKGGHLYL